MIREVQIILLNFGIISHIRNKGINEGGIGRGGNRIIGKHVCYQLSADGQDAEKFHKEIGFGLKRKQGIRKVRKNSGGHPIPYQNRFIEDIVIKKGGWSSDTKHRNIILSETLEKLLLSDIYKVKINESYSNVLNNLKYFWNEIKEIEDRKAEVVDFVIPETHSFFSNGFISHNSPISKVDLYFDPELRSEFAFMGTPAILDKGTKNERSAWPEFITLEELKRKERSRGPRIFGREFQCVVGDTKILTPEKIKPIKDIKIGDRVLGQSGFVRVKNIFKRQSQDIVTISTPTEYLELTPEHPVLIIDRKKTKKLVKIRKDGKRDFRIVPDGDYYKNRKAKLSYKWIPAGDICLGDIVTFPKIQSRNLIGIKEIDIFPFSSVLCYPSNKFVKPIPSGKKWSRKKDKTKTYQSIKRYLKINDESLRLFGFYISEGFSGFYPNTNSYCAGIASKDYSKRKEYQNLVKKTFGFDATIGHNELRIHNVAIANVLGNMFGRVAREKHFAEFCYKLSKGQFLILLESMIEGDGCFSKNTLTYCSSSITLLNQLLLILNSFDIRSSITKGRKGSFRLEIFKEGFGELVKGFKFNHKKIIVLPKTYSISSWLNSNFKLNRVIDVKKSDKSDWVYNLHTEDETYVANNILVHNCSPYYSEDSFFKKDYLMKKAVNLDLSNIDIRSGYDTDKKVIAGFDVGKKKHASLFVVFELNNNKAKMIHLKFMDKWPYFSGKDEWDQTHPTQLEYIKEAIKAFNIDEIYYDATRGEFEAARDQGIMPPQMIPIISTHRIKEANATAFDKAVMNKEIEIINDERLITSITQMTKELIAIEDKYGNHGEGFTSIALAFNGINKMFMSGNQEKEITVGGASIFDSDKIPKGF